MAIKRNSPPLRSFTLVQQRAFVEKAWPTFSGSIKRSRQTLVLTGQLMPTALSEMYTVRIEYKYKKRPKVFVEGISIDDRPPHTFEDASLCLYHRNGEGAFRSDMSIAYHLIPLVCHWLWCYEQWLVNPEAGWLGDEYPHPEDESKSA